NGPGYFTHVRKEYGSVRFGIVGCGMISEVQADAIGKVRGAEVVAFCDSVRTAAEARAARFGGRVYERVEDLAGDPDVAPASICTPSGTHMEAAIAAAHAKKHVIVEKPIEVSLDRIDPIVLACRTNGVKLGAIFPRRFMESSRLLRTAIQSGRFGTLVL